MVLLGSFVHSVGGGRSSDGAVSRVEVPVKDLKEIGIGILIGLCAVVLANILSGVCR